jgi:1,4-dihydroxy-2-naphthoate octaprenyltransferase
MILCFLGAFFYSAPPVRLASTGYGELTTSILVANLVPAFAFLLQVGNLHRLVAMTTFPLTALHLAMMLAFELPDYASDLKQEKRTLMVRLGWKTSMGMHNALILVAYLLLALAVTLGMPFFIALPAFFTLPVGLLQIWQMRRIAEGAAPNWRTLTLTALVLFGATAYLLAFAYWTR